MTKEKLEQLHRISKNSTGKLLPPIFISHQLATFMLSKLIIWGRSDREKPYDGAHSEGAWDPHGGGGGVSSGRLSPRSP